MLQVGQSPVPGYRLEKFLGRGAFGEVWQSTSPGGTKSALKFLNLAQQQGRKEFRAIQRLKQIRHANLMPINAMWLLDQDGKIIPDEYLDTDVNLLPDTMRQTMAVSSLPPEIQPSMLVIAMPQAELNLLELLRQVQSQGQQGLPLTELLDFMRDAAKAIDFLNSQRHDLGDGLVAFQHGDVKPENLMLMGGSVLLCDFGVAKTLSDNNDKRATSMGGSLAYIAPECLDGKPSNSSDQFSLGISYLELRTGELPFESHSTQQVIQDRMKGIIDLSKLSPAEAKVVQKALSAKPELRYRTTSEFIEALRATTAPVVSTRPTKALLLLGAALAGIAAIPVVLSRQGDSVQPFVPKQEVAPPDLPVEGRDQYAQALKIVSEPSIQPEQFLQAIEAYKTAIEKGYAASLPNPTLSNLNVLYEQEDRMWLGAATAINPDRSKVAWIGEDGKKIFVNSLWKIDGAKEISLEHRAMNLAWMNDEVLAISTHQADSDADSNQRLRQVYLHENDALQKIQADIDAMACSGGLCYALKSGRLQRIDTSVAGDEGDAVEVPGADTVSAHANLDSIAIFAPYSLEPIRVVLNGVVLPELNNVKDVELAIAMNSVADSSQGEVVPTVALTTDTGEPVFNGIYALHNEQWVAQKIDYDAKPITSLRPRSLSINAVYDDNGRAEILVGHEDGFVSVWRFTDEAWSLSEQYQLPSAEGVSVVAAFTSYSGDKLLVCGTQNSIEIVERQSSPDESSPQNSFTVATFGTASEMSSLQDSTSQLDEPESVHVKEGQIAAEFKDGLIAVWNLNHLLMVREACRQAGAALPSAPALTRTSLESF